MFSLDDNKKLGFTLTGLGLLLVLLGIFLFFDRACLSLGNFAFLMGLCFLQGIPKTVKFFLKKDKLIGSAFFFLGFFVTVFGHAFFGTLLQLYGLWRLFSSFLPNIINAVEMSPAGSIMRLPGFSHISRWAHSQHLPF